MVLNRLSVDHDSVLMPHARDHAYDSRPDLFKAAKGCSMTASLRPETSVGFVR